jgi:serine phosphatase RsbU (regulator of sigma subunit)/DNA-binding response OmpR family regulator
MTVSAGPTILVVDDRAPKRYLLNSWLTRAGYAVAEAENGHDAIEQLEHRAFDMVVLDVKLPDISGLDVCRWIKNDPARASTPVIHVSAHATDSADRTVGLVGGADAYLVEPIDPHELVATVQAVLRYYQARHQAEQLADGLAELAQTTLAVTMAENFEDLLTAAAAGASRLFGFPALVATKTLDGGWTAAIAHSAQEVALQAWDPPADEVPVGSRIHSGEVVTWNMALWPGDAPVTVATARLRADRPSLYVALAHSTDERDSQLLAQLTQALAAAAEAQRAQDQDHRIAITLQRSLLPRELPTVAGVDLAVRYDPASPEAEVGGDFYELSIHDGRLLVAIGDVVGHSLHAATVMAEIRYALRAYAVEGHSPGRIIELIDELMARLIPGELATLCLIMLDPQTGEASMANAGHLPPLLVTDGTATQLWHRAPLLGLGRPRPADVEFSLPRGSTLLLYTDGLIERRDASILRQVEILGQLAATVEPNLEAYCERLIKQLTRPPNEDDVAVVALRRL